MDAVSRQKAGFAGPDLGAVLRFCPRVLGRAVGFVSLLCVTAADTSGAAPHCHKDEDELILVLEGTGSLWLNGEIIPVSRGDCIGEHYTLRALSVSACVLTH